MEEFAVQARVGAHQPFTNRSAGESVNIEISGKYFDNGSMVYGIDLSTVNLRETDREQLDDIYDEPVGYYHYGTWAGYLGVRGYSGYALLPTNSGATTTCEDLNMRTDSMQTMVGALVTILILLLEKHDALGRSTYSDNFNYQFDNGNGLL